MCLSYNIRQYFADYLWLPCVADADIIFLSCGFFFLSFSIFFFSSRLIAVIADWMSAILPHMTWP